MEYSGRLVSSSWTRPFNGNNAFLYNAGSELNALTHNYETAFRRYDPALGRFNGADALASGAPSLSPYRFGFNNPVSFNDPTGLNEKPYIDAERGGGGIISGGENFGAINSLYQSIALGSGYHWSDGIGYSDWSPNGGSDLYRQGLAMGLTDLGGTLYRINGDGSRDMAFEKYGQLGFYEDLGDNYWQGTEVEINGQLAVTKELIQVATFVAYEAPWYRSAWNFAKDKSSDVASSFLRVGSSVVSPIVQNYYMFIKEGVHEGSPKPENKIKIAKVYSLDGWKVESRGLSTSVPPANESLETIKATTDVLSTFIPIKPAIGFGPPVLQKYGPYMINTGSKALFKTGRDAALQPLYTPYSPN